MGGMNPQMQALLQNPGFLAFLKQKMGGQGGAPPPGGGLSPVGPGGTAPFQASGGPLPTGQPPSQAMPPQAGPPPGQSPSPYKIQNQPTSSVGNMPPPKEMPISPSPQFSGGPVAGLLQLLANWHSTKQKGEHTEAANAAQALMQAIEAAKAQGANADWTPVYTILHNNEKLFNKVYKGWLQKSEMSQKPQKPEKVDPDVQGFEQGVQQYMQKKQQGGGPPPSAGTPAAPSQGQAPQGPPPPQASPGGMPPGAPPPGSAPRSIGGYLMPGAGAEQTLKQQDTSAELQARQQDPGRALTGQLSSPEQRQVELLKTGMASTPEAQAKLQAEMAHYQSIAQKAAADLQIASSNLQKAQADAQRAETEGKTAAARGETASKVEKLQVEKAQLAVDLARVKYQNAQATVKNGKPVTLLYEMKLNSAKKAQALIEQVSKENRGFSWSEVQQLQQELKTAGANSLATDLPGHWTNWMHGTGQVSDYAENVAKYIEGLEKAKLEWQSQFGSGAASTTPAEGKVDEEPDTTIDEDFDGPQITQEELDKYVSKKKKPD